MFGHFGAVLSQAQNQFVQRLACFGRHLDSREALVGSSFTDLNLTDLKIRAVGQNLIQHLRQNQRVNDMPAQLDRFRKHPQSLAKENDHAS